MKGVSGFAPDFVDMLRALPETGAEFLVVGAHAMAAIHRHSSRLVTCRGRSRNKYLLASRLLEHTISKVPMIAVSRSFGRLDWPSHRSARVLPDAEPNESSRSDPSGRQSSLPKYGLAIT